MKKYIKQFWNWYEDNLHLNIGIAAGLFIWQLIHLFWLTINVVFERLFSVVLLNLSSVWEYFIIAADYTEIPAIVAVSLVYINELREKRYTKRSILFLALLNSQWLHLFWITDEFVITHFRGEHSSFPLWFVWIAIMIDYIELPVIYDATKKFFTINKRAVV